MFKDNEENYEASIPATLQRPLDEAVKEAKVKKARIKKIKKALAPVQNPAFTNVQEELRFLVSQHRALTKSKVAIHHMSTDRKALDGSIIPCKLPIDVRVQLSGEDGEGGQVAELNGKIKLLSRQMTSALKRSEVYNLFLSKVHGMGPVTSAYLLGSIDIQDRNGLARKPSQLVRYCGLAVIDGKAERMVAKEVRHYNLELKTALYVAFASMRMTARGGSSKYLDIWNSIKERRKHSNGTDPSKPDGDADHKGRRVATQIFIQDLYTVWRASEGLPVWPAYRDAKLGYSHGGAVCNDGPRMMSAAEALAFVGNVSKQTKEEK